MPITVNLRHLEKKSVRLEGDLPASELDLDRADELIRLPDPLSYGLEAQKTGNNLLITGRLRIPLHCECSRCLKPFVLPLSWVNWTCHVPLEGEDRAVPDNDCVDLTPYVREDIVLAFPQRPLCDANCQGLNEEKQAGAVSNGGHSAVTPPADSPWSELDKLKLKH